MMINDALDTTTALAEIAWGIARDLRSMNRPSISLDQIAARIEDFFDDAPLDDATIAAHARDIARHPAIRSAIRP